MENNKSSSGVGENLSGVGVNLGLITYADSNYKEKQEKLCLLCKEMEIFNVYYTYSKKDIDAEFYNANKNILIRPRGSGYWLWKPYLILKALNKLNANDILMYLDSGDTFMRSPREFLLNWRLLPNLPNCHNILLTKGGYKHSDWTKKDCFSLMGCDKPEYHNEIQVEAGIIVCKKTPFAIAIFEDWLAWCRNSAIITDDPNTTGDNYPGFIDHRHDQSVLTNLAIQHKIPTTNDMREFVRCNDGIF